MAHKILVVDDDLILEMLSDVLTEEGYEVRTSVDGKAVQDAPAFQPDMILMDVMMPQMNGIEVSQHLKRNSATTHIPIILMTAVGQPPPRLAQAVVNGILFKPFDLDELLAKINGVLAAGAV